MTIVERKDNLKEYLLNELNFLNFFSWNKAWSEKEMEETAKEKEELIQEPHFILALIVGSMKSSSSPRLPMNNNQ
jgi:hypothetical protein